MHILRYVYYGFYRAEGIFEAQPTPTYLLAGNNQKPSLKVCSQVKMQNCPCYYCKFRSQYKNHLFLYI